MEYQMEKIGISCEKIKEATAVLKGEKEYVRTADRERYDAEIERKRKAEEQLRDEQEKRLKTITAGEEQEQEKEKPDEEEHSLKLARQQQEIIRQQEQLLQKQERHIEEQERILRRLEQEKIDLSNQSSQPQQSGSVQQPGSVQQSKPVQTGTAPKPSMSESGKIERYLKPSAMRFLPSCIKKERLEEDEEKEDDEVMITGVTEKPKRYIPKVIEGVPNVVLMEVPKTQRSAKRQRGPPVPEGRHDRTRFDCDNCDANYNRPDELVRHQRRDCGKVDPEHFCDECGKGFAKENGVCEHYYHSHTNITLWFCQKCGKGFNFKSNKSTHLKTCPLKNGPDKYVPRAPVNETLEATFKKRAAVPLQVVGQQEGDNPPQQVANPQPETTPQQVADPIAVQVAEPIPPQVAEAIPPQVGETTPQITPGNPAHVIMPIIAGEVDPQQQDEKSVYDQEAAKAVESIEGGDLLQVLSSGLIGDTGKSEEDEAEVEDKTKELDLEMVFDE